MHRRIPIFSAYPVFLSATTVQQVACEAHSDDSGATTAAVPIRSEPETYNGHENTNHIERRTVIGPGQLSRDLTLMDETSDSPPRATFGNVRIPSEARGDTPRLLPVEKKRKFTEHGAEARHVKRPNLDVQTGTSHEINEDLRAALIENEGLRAQIRDLQARFGHVTNRLHDLQDLADTVKKFADDMIADNRE